MSEAWDRYGRCVIASMREVLDTAPEDVHALLLETADYFLSLGLLIGTERPVDGARLLTLAMEREPEDLTELCADAEALVAEVRG